MNGGPEEGAGCAGLCAQLTPYQVGLCYLLLQYAQKSLRLSARAERRLFELLFKAIQLSRCLHHKSLRALERELCGDAEGAVLWHVLFTRLQDVDSPDALITALSGLEAA